MKTEEISLKGELKVKNLPLTGKSKNTRAYF